MNSKKDDENSVQLISVIIPCRNEELHIRKCIESILSFSLPSNFNLEMLFIDGMSDDRTPEIILEYATNDVRISLLQNPKRNHVISLNIGIKAAKGDYILRLDAHSVYPADYISLLYTTGQTVNADNIGGGIIAVCSSDKFSAKVVQALTTHPFGVGNSGFRTNAKSGYADTVPFGFFKKEVFEKYGLFNEKLVRNQDYEFNKRIWKMGGQVYRTNNVVVSYYNQASLGRFLKKQFNLEGPYHPYTWYLAPYCFNFRHAIPGIFTLSFLIGIILSFCSSLCGYIFLGVMSLYFLIAFISSIMQAVRYKNVLLIPVLPCVFFLYHFIYGLGILKGFMKLLFKQSPVQK
jgi:glycosyltransferase involved in cell wall biosynthesis